MKNILAISILAFSLNTFANDLVAINVKDISLKAKQIGNIKVKLNGIDATIESVEKSTVTVFSKGSFNLIMDANQIQYVISSTDAGFRKNALSDNQENAIAKTKNKITECMYIVKA